MAFLEDTCAVNSSSEFHRSRIAYGIFSLKFYCLITVHHAALMMLSKARLGCGETTECFEEQLAIVEMHYDSLKKYASLPLS